MHVSKTRHKPKVFIIHQTMVND